MYLTDKRATCTVVYIDAEKPQCCGLDLDKPLGVPLPAWNRRKPIAA